MSDFLMPPVAPGPAVPEPADDAAAVRIAELEALLAERDAAVPADELVDDEAPAEPVRPVAPGDLVWHRYDDPYTDAGEVTQLCLVVEVDDDGRGRLAVLTANVTGFVDAAELEHV